MLPGSSLPLNATRKLSSDLEVGGELAGLPAETTRYVTLDSLLALPQVTYTVTDDPNFAGPTKISGMPLEDLARLLGAEPSADLVVAICDDKYRANYPRAYVKEHHPLLVLQVNGEPPSRLAEGSRSSSLRHGAVHDFAPEVHSRASRFSRTPTKRKFRGEWCGSNSATRKQCLARSRRAGRTAGDAAVQAGYKIAQQNCFRCHNMGEEGGQKAGRPWLVLAALASSAPDYFSAYVRDPKKENANAQMPGNPGYDDATIRRAARLLCNVCCRRKSHDAAGGKVLLVFGVALFYAFVVFNNIDRLRFELPVRASRDDDGFNISRKPRDVARHQHARSAYGVLCVDHYVGSADDDSVLGGGVKLARRAAGYCRGVSRGEASGDRRPYGGPAAVARGVSQRGRRVVSDVAVEELEWPGRGVPYVHCDGDRAAVPRATGRGRTALVFRSVTGFADSHVKRAKAFPPPDMRDIRKAIFRTDLRARDRDCPRARAASPGKREPELARAAGWKSPCSRR